MDTGLDTSSNNILVASCDAQLCRGVYEISRKFSQYSGKVPTSALAFSLLKMHSSAFTLKNPLRHYMKLNNNGSLGFLRSMINDDLCPNFRLLEKGFSAYCESICETSLTAVAVKPQYNGLGTIKAPQK